MNNLPQNQYRILVIGLDGATFDLIKPWAREGHLPALAHLMAHGVHGALRSTIPPMTAPAWTSFATGVNPGKHGLYDWIARVPGSYTFTPVTSLDAKAPTIYSLLSEAGRRVCALNVPMTYPASPVNGLMISGMPAPSLKHTVSYPPDALEQIVTAIGDYMLYPDPGQAYSDSGVDAFLARLYACTELRVKAFDYLRQREPWDFAMMVFNGTDTVSHAMWKYMDREHPLHDPARYDRYGSAIRDFYRTVDGYLGQVIDTLPDDTVLVVMSDHGFGPFHKFIHVNNWLIHEGFMAIRPDARSRVKQSFFRAGFAPMTVYDWLMRLGLGGLKREVVRGQGQGLLKAMFLSFDDVDWQRTVAYSLGNVGQIYLNVKGREPFGCVEPGAAYEHRRDAILARLQDLRDPETGETIVEAVFRREEVYRGDLVARAPDILFLPRRLEYFGFGEYEFGSHRIVESMRRGISGTHRMNGIFLAYGAPVRPGLAIHGAAIVDLAPTMLHLSGRPVPAHMDGRVLEEALVEGFRSVERSTEPLDHGTVPGRNGQGLSDEDREVLAQRLRSLGYVG